MNRIVGSSTERPNGDIGRRYKGLPKRLGGLSVALYKIYLGLLGCIRFCLEDLKLSWGPWWLLMENVCTPNGKPSFSRFKCHGEGNGIHFCLLNQSFGLAGSCEGCDLPESEVGD